MRRARPIYLDHPATTPCDPRVIDAMLPWMQQQCANAGQSGHAPGRAAAAAVELARTNVAATLGLHDSGGVLFTSGATEANNLALLGSSIRPGEVVVIGATEHPSVLAPARVLAARGAKLRIVGVDHDGRLRLDELESALEGGAALVSVQAVNNETGVIQPVAAIGAAAHAVGAAFHVDAVQAFGKVPLDVHGHGIDLVTISGHKVGGPQGIGALAAREPARVRELAPLQHGGGQQLGIRPGTLNVPAIVGLGHAAGVLRTSGRDEAERMRSLRDRLERAIAGRLTGVTVNGGGVRRSPSISSITVDGIVARDLLEDLGAVAASTGSACSGGAPSHVLRAMGRTDAQVAGSMRLGIGRTTTIDEIDAAAELLVDAVASARGRRRTRRLVITA